MYRTRSAVKRQREEAQQEHGQPQTTIPMSILLRHVFPYMIDEIGQALQIGLICRMTYLAFRERRDFWEPFLWKLFKCRMNYWKAQYEFISPDILTFVSLLEQHYQMWPETLWNKYGLIGCVQSKIYFSRIHGRIPESICIGGDEFRGQFSFTNVAFCVYTERVPFNMVNYTGGLVYSTKKSDPAATTIRYMYNKNALYVYTSLDNVEKFWPIGVQ